MDEVVFEKGKIEVARRMIDNGMSLEDAAAVSGVDVELLRSRV